MRKSLRFGVLFLVIFFFQKIALADILITPTHVLFDDKQRFAEVTLANISNNPKSYEIEWQLFRMIEETGAYIPLEVVPEFDLSKLVFFAPRRVTLAPGGKQKIKLRFSRPAEIPDGDYHVHLKFKALPQEDKNQIVPTDKPVAQIKINISYTIPVIVRIGEANSGLSIGQINLDRDQNTGRINLKLPLERTGEDYSVLGYARVFHSAGGGAEELVGEISNANLFPEIRRRVLNIPLTKEISGGSLRVEVRSSVQDDDTLFVQKTFNLE